MIFSVTSKPLKWRKNPRPTGRDQALTYAEALGRYRGNLM